MICGLVAMGALGFLQTGEQPRNDLREVDAHPGTYVAAAVNVRWRDIEPAPETFDFAPIDTALDRIRLYNGRHRDAPIVAKLRVDAGLSAPGWVMDLSGGAVSIQVRGRDQAIPRFWTGAYGAAWRSLQLALARRYDGDGLVGEVAVTSCASTSDEPFILPLDWPNVGSLVAAGFSNAEYRACLSHAVDDYSAWSRTPLDFTFGLYRAIGTRPPIADPAFAAGVMRSWRERLGRRGVIATHGLDVFEHSGSESIYAEIAALGPPIAFQTYSPAVDFSGAVARGLRYRPTEMEMWNTIEAGGLARVDGQELRGWAKELSCGVDSRAL